MSEALTPETPETDSAAPSVEEPAPGDGTAVEVGSAGEAPVKMVEADRFNGLMSAHQRALSELESERARYAALEARINSSEETPEVADEAILARLDQMEERARRAERESAVARAIAKYPDAAPFADLFVGSDPEDIETVAAAVAQRAATLKGTAPVVEPVAEGGDAEPVVEPEAEVEAPVIGGGGSAAPIPPTTTDAVKAALESGSWDAYWKAKSSGPAQANLG